VFSPGSAKTNAEGGEKLNGHLMASCVRNIHTKNYQYLVIGFQVTVRSVWDVFFETQCVSVIGRSTTTTIATNTTTLCPNKKAPKTNSYNSTKPYHFCLKFQTH